MKQIKYYALYKGDTILCIGTKQELAKYLNVSERTIMFYRSPTYKRRGKEYSNRYLVIEIEEDD